MTGPNPSSSTSTCGPTCPRRAASDDLADTIDYGAVCDTVEQVCAGGRPQLLEHLAELVATAVLDLDPRITRASVAVRKLRPPVPQQLATSGVRLVRGRPDGTP